jgi:hypothetical protein
VNSAEADEVRLGDVDIHLASIMEIYFVSCVTISIRISSAMVIVNGTITQLLYSFACLFTRNFPV